MKNSFKFIYPEADDHSVNVTSAFHKMLCGHCLVWVWPLQKVGKWLKEKKNGIYRWAQRGSDVINIVNIVVRISEEAKNNLMMTSGRGFIPLNLFSYFTTMNSIFKRILLVT